MNFLKAFCHWNPVQRSTNFDTALSQNEERHGWNNLLYLDSRYFDLTDLLLWLAHHFSTNNDNNVTAWRDGTWSAASWPRRRTGWGTARSTGWPATPCPAWRTWTQSENINCQAQLKVQVQVRWGSGRSDLDLSSTLFLVFTRAWLPLMPLKSWALSSFEYFSKSRVICCLDFSLNWGSREYLLSFTRLTMWFPSFFYINCLRLWRDDRMLKLTVTEPDELVDVLNIL